VYLRLAGVIQHSSAEKLESLIGMGIRSRKIVLGRTTVERAVKDRKVRLLLVSAETQKNTLEWIEALSRYRRILFFRWPGPKPFEDVVHKANCRVAGVVDAGLAEEIKKLHPPLSPPGSRPGQALRGDLRGCKLC
jgi:ribosomal protein L7Ae-like RNA K-turn-binding protein